MDPTFIATTDDSFQWSSLSLITDSDHGIDIIEKSVTIEEEENQTIIDDIDIEGEKVDEKTNESAVDTNEEIKIATNTNQNSRIEIQQTEERGDVEQTVNKKEIETTKMWLSESLCVLYFYGGLRRRQQQTFFPQFFLAVLLRCFPLGLFLLVSLF